jgi:simple sugar transport system ATP-binding protein
VFKNYAEKLVRDYDVRTGSGVDTPMGSLSGGNQQKVLVAREIGLNSVLMIFVQPTRGLDIGAISYIHHQILDERGKGKAILLISLELSEIMDLADTIGVIFRGELLKIEDASKMTTSEVGRYMMGVKE